MRPLTRGKDNPFTPFGYAMWRNRRVGVDHGAMDDTTGATTVLDPRDWEITEPAPYTMDGQAPSLVAVGNRPGGVLRGNLAVLIRYWTRGKGAAKVRWAAGGAFRRCLRQLGKYVPPNQLHGFCARLYRIANGRWPGRRGNMGRG